MIELAHLRFADDVFPVVEALQRVRPLQAIEARDYYDGAPLGWYVVAMKVSGMQEIMTILAEVAASMDDASYEMLAAAMRQDGEDCHVVFFNLRGYAQTVH